MFRDYFKVCPFVSFLESSYFPVIMHRVSAGCSMLVLTKARGTFSLVVETAQASSTS